MLVPGPTKFRKHNKIGRGGCAKAGYIQTLPFALKALDRGLITARQIEAARVAIKKCLVRKGLLIIDLFPYHPVTKKPAETRMGKGKGSVDHYAAFCRPGQICFQLDNVTFDEAQLAFVKAAAKLPIRVKLTLRQERV